MMKSAYDPTGIYRLQVIKQAKLWLNHELITTDQFASIGESYKTPLFHPNFAIRILLFIATLIASSGVSGLVLLLFSDGDDSVISIASILLGVASFLILERGFIKRNHYKSGVTEGIAYMACGFITIGMGMLVDFDSITLIQFTCLLVFGFAAFRYVDLVLTLAFMITVSWTVFYHCYEVGGLIRRVIPFVFMIVFSGFYFIIRTFKTRDDLNLWGDNFLIMEVCCLLLLYAGGNYLVVRELSVNLMDLELQPGEDIPFAFLFYFFTVTIPLAFLWFGIRKKDKVLLRVSLIVMSLSVFTFRYYYNLGHPEIALMVAGVISSLIAILLMRYLKEVRNGFTSENILTSAWANFNVEALLISQTMGGNQPGKVEAKEMGSGGRSGGGGSSTTF